MLKAPDFPSVLVELGYLSNAHDVANLKSTDWRNKTTDAIRAAIDGFFGKSDAALTASAPDRAKPSP